MKLHCIIGKACQPLSGKIELEDAEGSKLRCMWKPHPSCPLDGISGQVTYANGDYYSGQCLIQVDAKGRRVTTLTTSTFKYVTKFEKHGQGYLLSNGSTWNGVWKNGQKDGIGRLTGADGIIIDAVWVAGKKCGPGAITNPVTNTKEMVWWEDDKQVEEPKQMLQSAISDASDPVLPAATEGTHNKL